jgi:hypothetical protein
MNFITRVRTNCFFFRLTEAQYEISQGINQYEAHFVRLSNCEEQHLLKLFINIFRRNEPPETKLLFLMPDGVSFPSDRLS